MVQVGANVSRIDPLTQPARDLLGEPADDQDCSCVNGNSGVVNHSECRAGCGQSGSAVSRRAADATEHRWTLTGTEGRRGTHGGDQGSRPFTYAQEKKLSPESTGSFIPVARRLSITPAARVRSLPSRSL